MPVAMDPASRATTLLTQAFGQSLAQRFPAFAFRMPGESVFYWGACRADALVALTGGGIVDGDEGFLFAPFDTAALPSFFFPVRPIPAEAIDLNSLNLCGDSSVTSDEPMPTCDTDYASYEQQALTLIGAMRRGELRKAVLSRTVTLRRPSLADADLFLRLAVKYPGAFVSWVHLPGHGCWMGATPETLLDYAGCKLSTMALAGTRKAGTPGEWGEKEREEQQIVADTIVAALERCALTPVVGSRFTKVAAQVEHLCTPISVVGDLNNNQLNDILCALHPTPAVGGYPKEAAKVWIDRVEPHRRRYYGGYLGPVQADGMHLFVNLRCMEVDDWSMRLYVGGGLTAQSQPASEWSETEAKAQTLLSVIND